MTIPFSSSSAVAPSDAVAIPLGHGPVALTDMERSRYVRQLIMANIGFSGQERLKGSRVVVVGAGGLGSPVIAYLARAGVGTIGVIDDDDVETSNLHRQLIHDDASVGISKVESAARAVAAVNPFVEVIGHHEHLNDENAERILSAYDLVVDGTDDFRTRYTVADTTARLGIPCVWGTVLATDGQLATFWSQWPEGGVTLRDVYPDEPPSSDLSCATAGVLGPLCGMVASWMAAEAVKLIVGFGRPLLGRMLSVDAFDGTTTEIEVRPANRLSRPGVDEPRPAAASVTVQTEPAWITVRDLIERRRAGASPVVLDVREPNERALVAISDSTHIPLGELAARVGEVPPGSLVVHCHHDTRARRAEEILRNAGRDDVLVLRGGIDAWAEQIDPSLPRY